MIKILSKNREYKMSGDLVLHVHSNLKNYVESTEIKKFVEFLKEDKIEYTEFFKPETFRLRFELIDNVSDDGNDKIVKFSTEVSMFKFVKIISALYETKDISCSKDGKHLYYKNIEIDNYEFEMDKYFAFVIKKEVGKFEDFIENNDVKFHTRDGVIIVDSNDGDEYVYLDNSLHIVNEYDLSKKYSFIKSINKGKRMSFISSPYDFMKTLLPKEINEDLNILDAYPSNENTKPEEIGELNVIISNESLTGTYARDIRLTDYIDFLNQKTKSLKFSVSPDGTHIYYQNKEVIGKITSSFRTLLNKFKLSKEVAEDFRQQRSLKQVSYKVLKYAIRHDIPGFAMNSYGVLSYFGEDMLSIGISPDDELEIFEEHELNIDTNVLNFYLSRNE